MFALAAALVDLPSSEMPSRWSVTSQVHQHYHHKCNSHAALSSTPPFQCLARACSCTTTTTYVGLAALLLLLPAPLPGAQRDY